MKRIKTRRSAIFCVAALLNFVAYADASAKEGSHPNLKFGTTKSIAIAKTEAGANSKALAFRAADLNYDGVIDIVASYAQGSDSYLTLSTSVDGAANAALRSVDTPVAAELMAVGDFNSDGRSDLAIAKFGDKAFYIAYGERSQVYQFTKFALEANVDALATSNHSNKFAAADLVVASSNSAGAKLWFYQDALNKKSSLGISGKTQKLEIADADGDAHADLLMLVDGTMQILHGDDSGRVSSARIETLSQTRISDFAIGDLIWDRDGKNELALQLSNEKLVVLSQGDLATQAFTRSEVIARRRAQLAGQSSTVPVWRASQATTWKQAASFDLNTSALIAGAFSSAQHSDLIWLDSASNQLNVLSVAAKQQTKRTLDAPASAVLAVAGTGLPALYLQSDGGVLRLPLAPLATFNVTKTTDSNDGSCDAGDCSLREAIGAANLAAGPDTVVVPAGTYTLTIANTGGFNEDSNAQGDLDINDDTTINGAGAANTIIQAGTTTTNGIDKVIAVNPSCATAINVSITGVTIRFGRNTQPAGASDFSFSGGGIDVCNTGSGSFTLSNSTVDQNNATTAYGGGINFDSVQPASGNYAISGSTISNNRTSTTVVTDRDGGGINLWGDQHNVTVSNSTISGNTSASNGGGVNVRHSNGGAVLIQNTSITGNTAANRGGGISNQNFSASSLTINTDSVVANNTSTGTASGGESRGGGIFVNTIGGSATTINEVTITGNIADAGPGKFGGGIAALAGPVTATFNRIAGNTATNGSGLHVAGPAVNAASNWWGCNAGPGAAPCDRSVVLSGSATVTPRLQLTHTASPSTIVVGQTSALTASFLTDSASGAVAVGNLDAIIGTTHAHNNPVLGAHSATQAAIQATGTATATFTANAAGTGSSSSVVDSQTQVVNITINKANTTTTITADTPDPSPPNSAVTVNYSVVVNAPGAGTPTGNVTVTASPGGETCTGTVAAGNCSITLIAAGARTLTATYASDANFNGSTSIAEPHTVQALPALSITDVSATEGNGGTSNYNFTVSLAQPAGMGGVSFNIATADGTSAAGTDYVANSLTSQTIAAGQNSYVFTVVVSGDTLFEGNETFFVNVSNLIGASAGDLQGQGTITNDDAAPTISINAPSATEGNAGTTSMNFVVSLSAASGLPVSFNFATGVGTATAGTDYVAIASTAGTIAAGATSSTIPVTINGDATSEPNETVVLDLSSISGATPATLSGTGTILDDDAAQVTINDVSVDEGNSGTTAFNFTVARSSNAGAFTVNYATSDGTAIAGSDYAAASGTLTFAAGGALSQTVTVQVTGELSVELAETFNVNLSNLVNTTLTANITDNLGVGSITNDDSATVQFNPITVSQSEATSPMAFTVTLSNPVQSGVTVRVDTATGTAIAADFTEITNSTVTFAANSTTAQTVNVTINNDALFEADETFTATLSNLTATGSVTLGAASATGTITNDDAAPTISINAPSATEGNAGTTPMNFVVTLSTASGLPVSFNFATGVGTATAGTDYVAIASTAGTIAAGATSSTIPVTINGDTAPELNETVILDLTGISGATPATLSGTGTISDDDAQTTTTTIVSDLPDPSVVGQAYPVTVQVAALTSSPPGTVSVSDGTDSCTLTVTAGTSPNSTGSCNLTSTTAGAKTLTATYTPANIQFISSSATTAHQVNAAATTISLTGPATTPLNQATSYSFTLAVTAPGAGSPAGTVTIQAGTSSCTVNLPTATPSCSLSFTAVGPQTVSATFTPSNGNFLTSSTTSSVSTLVFARADLSVTKTNGASSYRSGDLLVYTIIARNLGPDAAPQVQLVDNVPAQLENVSWTCSASGGLFCPAAGGVGNISQSIASFPVGGQLTYTLSGNVIGLPAQISNTATLQLPANNTVQATTPANLSATDTDLSDSIFASGFEDAVGRISGPSGQFRFPSAALRTALDETAVQVYSLSDQQGEALRVYARVLDGEIQYAIAIRNTQGKLILGRFQSYATEPVLQWQAREQGGNWVFLSAAFL